MTELSSTAELLDVLGKDPTHLVPEVLYSDSTVSNVSGNNKCFSFTVPLLETLALDIIHSSPRH